MESNKLLIGVQFIYLKNGTYEHLEFELYVLRDILFYQLLDGIQYGMKKKIKESDTQKEMFMKCNEIFEKCICSKIQLYNGENYWDRITFTSFDDVVLDENSKSFKTRFLREPERFVFYESDEKTALYELGFITSSRIIFDVTGKYVPEGRFNTRYLTRAFQRNGDPDKIHFPEYNISTRILSQFNTEPVQIISPTDPPKRSTSGLAALLLPSVLSMGVLVVTRSVLSSGGNTLKMALASVIMGSVTVVTTVFTWKKQKKEYEESVRLWRNQYEKYIDDRIWEITTRQENDKKNLSMLYPDAARLIAKDESGIYRMSHNLYSRVPGDDDFLTIRLGWSNDVESKFEIQGEKKETIFSEASCEIVSKTKNGKEVEASELRIYLKSDNNTKFNKGFNLCRLPLVLANNYKKMKDAPLLYSLKDTGMLGLISKNIDIKNARIHYFISKMIFELCYYHSPEELQFIIFFKKTQDWKERDEMVQNYCFMPHFRGLFSDKSQFAFDEASAGQILNNMMGIMAARQGQREEGQKEPHIVFLVYDEYNMKEHAFAQYLPTAPAYGGEFKNALKVTFIFPVKYREYLPAFCNYTIDFEDERSEQSGMMILPRENVNDRKAFYWPEWENAKKENSLSRYLNDYRDKYKKAMTFFAAIHYQQISQSGKVPSSVSAFELFGFKPNTISEYIRWSWGESKNKRHHDITKTLQVAIGKTQSGIEYLDLHEKCDGPHMLVAGTTGSGKTETVISILIGLCLTYKPDEVNLLLVDMKGGGFTKRIGMLPHVVGTVTDVDGDENGTGSEYMLKRFLNAMRAEIKRRKILFNKMEVDSIDNYIQACNMIEAHIEQKQISGQRADEMREMAKNERLTHLLLVVDEFAELKRFSTESDDVDFIGEITTIARVGRSLGFHIILISQNIEGAITEDISINSKSRLCLKVATRTASKQMIGTDLAALPSMPGNGRAYLLVGTGSKMDYFQSAYSGATTVEDIPCKITYAQRNGLYEPFYDSGQDNLELIEKKEKLKREGKLQTQLESIVAAIMAVSKEEKFASKPHIVFQQPLPARIALDSDGRVVNLDLEKSMERQDKKE